MAKAVVPMGNFRQKFGDLGPEDIGVRLQALVHEFLQHDQPLPEKKREPAGIKS